MAPATHVLTMPGAMLHRGFWLYVWRVETPAGELLSKLKAMGAGRSGRA